MTSMLTLKKLCVATASLISLTSVNQAYGGLIYQEAEDAGITVSTYQPLTSGTTSVFGTLNDNDGADVYGFFWKGGEFFAGTQGSDFDTMLSVYDVSGTLLAFNDDLIENGKISFVSTDLPEGNYLLGITYYDNNYNGDIVGYSNIGIDGSYQIEISPSSEQNVPEPQSLALLAIGLAGLALSRRRIYNFS